MTYAFYWRKAITVSVCLHIFLLAAAGYLTAGLTATVPLPAEIILDMDLVGDPLEQAGNAPGLPEPSTSPPAPRSVAAESMPVKPIQAETEVKPVVTTSKLAITEAETPAMPASGQPRDTSGTGGVSTSGATASGNNGNGNGGGMGGAGSRSGIAAPGILSRVAPVYPPVARQAGLEGTVVLKIQILANGRPGEIAVTRSSGYPALDEAAVAVVRQWQFIPAKDLNSGRTVTCTTTLPVSFRLHDHKQ